MAKRTRKQAPAQQARKRSQPQLVSKIRKQLRTLFVSRQPLLPSQPLQQPPDGPQLAFLTPSCPPKRSTASLGPSSVPLPASPAPLLHDLHFTASNQSMLANFRAIGSETDRPKQNLLLRDNITQAPICMRISPTLVYKQTLANKSAQKGCKLYQELKSCIPDQDTRGSFELGILHSPGEAYFGFTQVTKGKHKDKATELLNWAREHSQKYLQTLKTLLPAEWKQDMESRKVPADWLKDYFKRQTKLLNPWWTTTTFFDTFTGKAHRDPDHQPSFLFNFGAPCYLVLHDYNIKVQLDHLDIAIFNTNTVQHSTQAADTSGAYRWAFSAFFRRSIYQQKGPAQLGKELLDKVLGPDDGETRARSANK